SPGDYRINTQLFTIRQVPITKIAPDELGLVEATEGNPLKQGQSFGKIVPCNHFQDAQAFFEHGGQAGKQLATLTAGKYYINTDIFKIRKISAVEIIAGEIGLVEAKYGNPLAQGESFAQIVQCDNFQDAQAFLSNGGQAGKQLAILKPGQYYINTDIFKVRKAPTIRIPKGEIGLVVANDGAAMSSAETLGRVVDCDNFQNAEAFLQQGGQKGKQLAILKAGDYQINTELFTVITTANARKYAQIPEKLKVYKIQSDMIGIVTTQVGKTLPNEERAGSEIEGHGNYQDGQKFLDLGGYKGLQEEVLLEGEWNLNPWFVEVEQVPVTKIEHEEVGVVISSVGKEYHKQDGDQNASVDKSDESKSLYQLVEPGYKGVENKPLTAGHYAMNTRVKTVKRVPTTQIILNWSNKEKKDPSNYDAELDTLKLTSSDGYEFKVKFTQIIRIAPENAPKMICLIGSESSEESISANSPGKTKKYPAIRNLVTRVLTKVVSGHFQKVAAGKTAIDFQKDKTGCENEAETYINGVLEEIGVEGRGTYIETIDLPEHLDEYRQQGAEAELERELLEKQQSTEKQRQQLVEEQQKTQAQEQLIKAKTRLDIAKMDAQTNLEQETARAQADQLHNETHRQRLDIDISGQERISQIEVNAFRERTQVLSPELYAQIETQGKWAEALAQMQINYPDIMIGGGNSPGDPFSNTFQLMQLNHLDELRNRLNPGTPTQQLPIQQPTSILPTGNRQNSLPTEFEPRIPVVLLLDTSASMSTCISQLMQGIDTFRQELMQSTLASHSVEVAMITFGDSAQIVQDFTPVESLPLPQLVASGKNAMDEAIELALNQLESRKATYKSSGIQEHSAWMLLIAGSTPNNSWHNAGHRITQAVANRELNFFAVGIQEVDMDILSQIAPPSTPPQILDGWKFKELFHWLADALKRAARSEVGSRVNLPPIREWVRRDLL
ncbi:MAG: VWA domain-containing protein, partial [Symploca sp. SIO3E6]|nr:VWA domain-containing protein [Caldora sp. SIO3E6]